MLAHVMLAGAREQPGLIQDWLAHRDPILAELFSFSSDRAACGLPPEWGVVPPPSLLTAGDKREPLRAPTLSPSAATVPADQHNDYDIIRSPSKKSSYLEEKFISSVPAVYSAELLVRVAYCLSPLILALLK